jgi:fibronectin-binding autotransporter adhesin
MVNNPIFISRTLILVAFLALPIAAQAQAIVASGSITGATLNVIGDTTIGGTLNVTGALSYTNLSVADNATIGGTLGVTGATTLGSVTSSKHLTGSAFDSNATINMTAVGSGTNGPATAQNGLTINATKDNWWGTPGTPAVGEIDGMAIFVRQGGAGSDAGGILVNVQNTGTGFLAATEMASSIVDTSTNTLTQYMDIQEGGMNPGSGDYIGAVYTAGTGALSTGVQIQNVTGASWTNAIKVVYDNSPVFSVDGTTGGITTSGNVSASGNTTTNGLTLPTITGSTQYLQVDSSGVVSGTGIPSGGVGLSTMQTWLAAQTYTNSDLKLLGSGAGVTTFTSANSSGTNYTLTTPAYSGTAVLTTTVSPVQGDILYFNGTTWADLGYGISGYFLETLGVGANPQWAAAAGGTGCTVSGGSQYQLIVNNGSSGCSSNVGAALSLGALTLGASGTAGSLTMGNASTGLITFQPVSGPITGTLLAPTGGGTLALTSQLPTGANPTATMSTTAVNGSAATFMRSDGAPPLPVGSSSTFGAVKVDGTTITATAGVISGVSLSATNAWPGQQTFAAVLGSTNAATGSGTSCNQAATTCTIVAADCGTTIPFYNGASAVTVTIPASIVPVTGKECVITVRQYGTAKVSVNGSAVSAATLLNASGYTGTRAAAGASITLSLETVNGTHYAVLTGDGS